MHVGITASKTAVLENNQHAGVLEIFVPAPPGMASKGLSQIALPGGIIGKGNQRRGLAAR